MALRLPPFGASKGPARRAAVFYNPATALDRDLNVALVRAALGGARASRGVELCAATGVRGLRLLAETEAFRQFVLLERNPEAVRVLAENAAPWGDRGARVLRTDAMRPGVRDGFDYVDVDPFGTPVPYLESALDLLRPEGLLAVTATDLPVLCGVARGVAERRYGGRPIRGRLGPEGGLRLLLAELARRARRRGRAIAPIAAYVHDHHVRAFVRAGAPRATEDPVGTLAPATFDGPTLPAGGPYGPMWLGPLFDAEVISRIEVPEGSARPREATRWIERFREEAPLIAPFYYEPNELARALHLSAPPPPDAIVLRLRRAGFPVGRTHVREAAIRTPAPRSAVEAATREAAEASRLRGAERSDPPPV